ncbi:unnamed protein product [Nezara viridula]|uniref:Uncharacterized protein n=1 Tax=Nezara viridula TaxID=85310 RepID=A0A9P0HBA9_NEZVI|nr:unnamed protein product [Nezara viridula]
MLRLFRSLKLESGCRRAHGVGSMRRPMSTSVFTKATFEAISKTYGYLTPDLWRDVPLSRAPYAEFSDHLLRNHHAKAVPVDE